LKNDNRHIHWPSVWQFALSAIAAVALLGAGLSLALAGLAWRFDRSASIISATPFFLMAAGLLMSGMLLLPSAGFALLRLIGYPRLLDRYKLDIPYLRPTLLFLLVPVILYAGHLVNSQLPDWEWLLLPPIHLLAIGLPLLWLVFLGGRGLSSGSQQQTWGILGSGLALSPLLIMVAEIVAAGLFLVFGAFYLLKRPGLVEELSSLAQRLVEAPPNPAVYQRLLEPILLQPGIVYGVFIFIAVVVPLIEEALKPVGVWLLAGRDISPSTGFAAGLLSGAGFALFESLAFTSNANQWSLVASARIGTGVIHIVTAALTGWALVTAWQNGRYLRLGLTYLTAVFVHASWNGLTLLATSLELTGSGILENNFITHLAEIAPLGLGVLAITAFAILLGANSILRKQEKLSQLEVEPRQTVL
jgi:hypothetical protein